MERERERGLAREVEERKKRGGGGGAFEGR